MNKDNAMYDFNTMIQKSWTYNRMTTEEKKRWIEVLNDVRCDKCLKGTYKHRWDILQAMYSAYLIGLGYDNFNWREEMLENDK